MVSFTKDNNQLVVLIFSIYSTTIFYKEYIRKYSKQSLLQQDTGCIRTGLLFDLTTRVQLRSTSLKMIIKVCQKYFCLIEPYLDHKTYYNTHYKEHRKLFILAKYSLSICTLYHICNHSETNVQAPLLCFTALEKMLLLIQMLKVCRIFTYIYTYFLYFYIHCKIKLI